MKSERILFVLLVSLTYFVGQYLYNIDIVENYSYQGFEEIKFGIINFVALLLASFFAPINITKPSDSFLIFYFLVILSCLIFTQPLVNDDIYAKVEENVIKPARKMVKLGAPSSSKLKAIEDIDDEVRQIFTPNNFYPNIKEDVAEAIAFAPGAEAVSETELDLLSANKKGYIWKYLTKKRTPKAMVGAVPLSCNYRYYHSASKNLSSAISSAYKGCIDKISQYNQLLNKNCNCRLIALNNTLFYESSVYLGELGYTPILAQVEQNGQKILINGVAEWDKPGASFANFVLKNDKNIKICDGSFDIRSRAKGAIKINCFNGKFAGSGEFVTSGFDEELRVANGTAVINLGDGNEMRVVYGRDAM